MSKNNRTPTAAVRQQNAARAQPKFDASDSRPYLQKMFSEFEVSEKADFDSLLDLLIYYDTVNRWFLFKKNPTMNSFSFGEQTEEAFCNDLLKDIHKLLKCPRKEILIDATLSNIEVQKYINEKYSQLARFFLIIDHIRGLQRDCQNTLRTVISRGKILGVYVDNSQDKPGVAGITKGTPESPHRGLMAFASLTNEEQEYFKEEWFEIGKMLQSMSIEPHVGFNIFNEIKKFMEKLIIEKDMKNIVRLLSELYNGNIGELIHGEETRFYSVAQEFTQTEHLKNVWKSRIMTDDGKKRVLIMVSYNMSQTA